MRLDGIAFLMTDKCNASCNMCCFSCTPKGKALLDKEMIKNYIRQAAEIETVKTISFSGGEAILYYEQLKECMEYAKGFGLRTTLVTNGFWAKNYEKGYEMIKGLVDAGMTDMSISVDKYHQEFVPIESVKNAICIASELGIMSAVTMMDLKDGESVFNSIEALRPEIYGKDLIVYPVFPAGKALETIDPDQLIRACDSSKAACPFDHFITVLFDGTLMMCCTQFSVQIPMTHLGKFGETSIQEAIHNFQNNDFIYVMFSNGLSWYAELARNLGFPVEEKYCVSCHLCHELLGNPEFVEKAKPYVTKEAGRIRLKKLLSR